MYVIQEKPASLLRIHSNLFGVVVHHAGRIIHSQADVVLSFAGFGPPQPDLVLAKLTGDVGDHFPHVQAFPCTVIASVKPENSESKHVVVI